MIDKQGIIGSHYIRGVIIKILEFFPVEHAPIRSYSQLVIINLIDTRSIGKCNLQDSRFLLLRIYLRAISIKGAKEANSTAKRSRTFRYCFFLPYI